MPNHQVVAQDQAPESRGLNLHVPATLLGLAGIATLFLPFTYGESPMSAVTGRDLWRLALPFFLAILVSLASLRRIIGGKVSRLEMAIGYLASISVACLTLSIFFQESASDVHEWIILALPPVTTIAGGFLVIKNLRKGIPHGLNIIVSLQVAYLANCLPCLVEFLGDWQVGAYFALLTVMVYSSHIVIISLIGN